MRFTGSREFALDVAQDAPQNQIESNRAAEAIEVVQDERKLLLSVPSCTIPLPSEQDPTL